MRTHCGSSNACQCFEQRLLFAAAEFASSAHGGAAGEADEQVVFPVGAILGGGFGEFLHVGDELLLSGTVFAAGDGAYQEAASAEAFAFYAESA